MRVIDGTHRRLATLFKGRSMWAVEANSAHGLPLSSADRRAGAKKVVQTHPHLSDRAIALAVGLGPKSIATIRRRSTDSARQLNAPVGRDGRLRPVNGDEGRHPLRLLGQNAMGTVEWADLVAAMPAHCESMVKELARRCVQMWLGFAQELDDRIGPQLGGTRRQLNTGSRTLRD